MILLKSFAKYKHSIDTWINESLTAVNPLWLLLLLLFYSRMACGQTAGLFDSDEILEFTLQCDMRAMLKDRGDDPQYHEAILHYEAGEKTFDIPVRLRARGNFRKMASNCKYPPLFVNFKKSTTPEESVFRKLDKIKLVTPCRGDEYVINEYLVYKLYNLITSKSMKARLVKVIYHDTKKGNISDPYYGILLEEEKQMIKRCSSNRIEVNGFSPKELDQNSFLHLAVFQYMIGNTDWSVQYQQNIILMLDDLVEKPIPVPYDFDHAGVVRAPYAKPAPELLMRSTLQRQYRGYCLEDIGQLSTVFDTFNELKEAFYAVYIDNDLLSSKYIDQTTKFLDQFYDTINDPGKAWKDFSYPCDPTGTGNVVIRGLKSD